jgi:hypothetical protein
MFIIAVFMLFPSLKIRHYAIVDSSASRMMLRMDFLEALARDMRINLRSRYIRMTQQ